MRFYQLLRRALPCHAAPAVFAAAKDHFDGRAGWPILHGISSNILSRQKPEIATRPDMPKCQLAREGNMAR